jgi:hypothetical protein
MMSYTLNDVFNVKTCRIWISLYSTFLNPVTVIINVKSQICLLGIAAFKFPSKPPFWPKELVQVRCFLQHFVTSWFFGKTLLAPLPTFSWKTTPYRVSATAYSIYLQLPSIAGGRLLDPPPENAPRCGGRGPHNMVRFWSLCLLFALRYFPCKK